MCVTAHDAGLGVHQHLGDLHAADLAAGDVRVARLVGDGLAPLALALGLVHAEPGAELLPRPLLLVLRVDDLARLDRQVLRVGPDLRRDLLEQVVAGRLRRQQRRRRLRRAGGAAAGAGRRPYWLSPILTMMSVGFRPRISAATMAVTVRWAVPRSCVEVSAVTRAVAADGDGALVRLAAGGEPPQVCSAMPMPCLTVPALPLPGGCHFSFQSDSLTAMSSCSL